MPKLLIAGKRYTSLLSVKNDAEEIAYELVDTSNGSVLFAGYIPVPLKEGALTVTPVACSSDYVSHCSITVAAMHYQRRGNATPAAQVQWDVTITKNNTVPVETSLRRFFGSDAPGLRISWPLWPVPGYVQISETTQNAAKELYRLTWSSKPEELALPIRHVPGKHSIQVQWVNGKNIQLLGQFSLDVVPGISDVSVTLQMNRFSSKVPWPYRNLASA